MYYFLLLVVQAIDAAYIGSEFSEELSLTLGDGSTTSNPTIIVADTFGIAENSPDGTVVGTI